jgi:hypothetical protein
MADNERATKQPEGGEGIDSIAKSLKDKGFYELASELYSAITNGLKMGSAGHSHGNTPSHHSQPIEICPYKLSVVFKELVSKHEHTFIDSERKINELSIQLEQLRESYAKLESEYQSKFEKDKTISIAYPQELLKVKEDSLDSDKSFRPDEDDSEEETKRKIRAQKDKKMHEKIAKLENQVEILRKTDSLIHPQAPSSNPVKMPQMGLPPQTQTTQPTSNQQPQSQDPHAGHRHAHGARCCHDHNHLLINHHGF